MVRTEGKKLYVGINTNIYSTTLKITYCSSLVEFYGTVFCKWLRNDWHFTIDICSLISYIFLFQGPECKFNILDLDIEENSEVFRLFIYFSEWEILPVLMRLLDILPD